MKQIIFPHSFKPFNSRRSVTRVQIILLFMGCLFFAGCASIDITVLELYRKSINFPSKKAVDSTEQPHHNQSIFNGKLIDFDTDKPIPEANVMLRSSSNRLQAAESDSSGNFSLNRLEAGSYTIRLQAENYFKLYIHDIKIGADTSINKTYYLKSKQ